MTEEHAEVERKLREFFDDNFDILKLESGHTITEDTKRLAWNQVLYYWKKLHGIAQHVTDTEVRLSLPNQKTKKGRTFSIDGVVDIVKEHGETSMYDIKTHDAEYIRGNKDFYQNQLNVYTYIWQKLRGNRLDHTAIISTVYPKALRDAIYEGNTKAIEKAMHDWQPVIEMPFSKESVERTVEDFSEVVDAIEDNLFSSPPIKKLMEKVPGTNRTFVSRVCSNCDARFTCPSFRKHISKSKGTHVKFKEYIDIARDDLEQEEWANANLEASQGLSE